MEKVESFGVGVKALPGRFSFPAVSGWFVAGEELAGLREKLPAFKKRSWVLGDFVRDRWKLCSALRVRAAPREERNALGMSRWHCSRWGEGSSGPGFAGVESAVSSARRSKRGEKRERPLRLRSQLWCRLPHDLGPAPLRTRSGRMNPGLSLRRGRGAALLSCPFPGNARLWLRPVSSCSVGTRSGVSAWLGPGSLPSTVPG